MAEVPISNWVKFKPGEEKTLRFAGFVKRKKSITDPITKAPKEVEALELGAVMEDGVPVSRTLSVIAEGLAGDLGPYLIGDRYLHYEFTIRGSDRPGQGPRLVRAVPI